MQEKDLDDLFALSRADTAAPGDALMARILADAARVQPHPAHATVRRRTVKRSGFWARMSAAVGGNGVLAGLGTAAVAGIMLGFVQPASVTAVTDTIFAQTPADEVDILAGIDDIFTEG